MTAQEWLAENARISSLLTQTREAQDQHGAKRPTHEIVGPNFRLAFTLTDEGGMVVTVVRDRAERLVLSDGTSRDLGRWFTQLYPADQPPPPSAAISRFRRVSEIDDDDDA